MRKGVEMKNQKSVQIENFVKELYEESVSGDIHKKSKLYEIAQRSNPEMSANQLNSMIYNLWNLEGTSRKGRGMFQIPEMSVFEDYLNSVSTSTANKVKGKKVEMPKKTKGTKKVVDENQEMNYVPVVDKNYVKWGDYKTIEQVIKSRMFYPIFITGLSGNGKTMMVEQSCARNKRDMYRVNITCRTDEDDLLGGFRLVDGQTIWFDGPVVKAMKTGAVLLLDEIDLASDDIMCLQPILEGKGVFLKKINKFVEPSEGFQVFATANTKGQGDEHGKFVGTGFLNEAFLERFPVTVEQTYPKKAIEIKILTKYWESLETETPDDIEDMETLIDQLVTWAGITRTSYNEAVLSDLITTRRLVFIMKAYSIFGNIQKSIELNLNRFDDLTKMSFIDLFKKVSAIEDMQEDDVLKEEVTTVASFEEITE
jgi:cobaltochelatase CobS